MKKVLVTGASKGIGQASAILLAKSGFEIVVHYNKDIEGANNTLDMIKKANGAGSIMCFDVSDRMQTKEALETYMKANGAFYGVVNSAGIVDDVVFPSMTETSWDRVIHTNLDSFYNVIQPCVLPMIQLRKGGRIVTLSSVSGVVGNQGQVNYSAAKAGIIGATKALALELAKRKITVNCIAPGLIDTDMTQNLEHRAEIERHIPMRRAGTVTEVASLVNYLFSPEASYITRQVISVNGGLV